MPQLLPCCWVLALLATCQAAVSPYSKYWPNSIAICAVMKGEHVDDIREWLAYHRRAIHCLSFLAVGSCICWLWAYALVEAAALMHAKIAAKHSESALAQACSGQDLLAVGSSSKGAALMHAATVAKHFESAPARAGSGQNLLATQ